MRLHHSPAPCRYVLGRMQRRDGYAGFPKWQLVVSIVCVWLLSQAGGLCAAGPFDGEWNGIATPDRARCRPARVTLIVAGKIVTGEARFEGESSDIRGTVWEDGSFGATVGFRQLAGTFSGDAFEGAFQTADCAWKILLRRKK